MGEVRVVATATAPQAVRGPADEAAGRVIRPGGLAYRLSGALGMLGLSIASNRWALAAGYLAGVALVAWILVQLLVLQRFFFLQLVIAGIGLLEILLAWLWQRGADRQSTGRDTL